MPFPTVSDVVNMSSVLPGGPVVLSGNQCLDNEVRWVHTTELADIATLLRRGDLVLTTGSHLPSDDTALAEFACSLADAGCSGLIVELGRRWRNSLPESLVEGCEVSNLPLVALTRVVRFAAVAQAVGERIVDGQLADLRDAQRVHEVFTELSFTSSGQTEVLAAVHRLSGCPVVIENEQHRPLDFLADPGSASGFLDHWQRRSSQVSIAARTGWDATNGWLVTRLGPDGQSWGRLVIGSYLEPSQRLVAVAERAAAALALQRLNAQHHHSAARRTHHELIHGLRTRAMTDDLIQRCALADFPVTRRQFVGMTVRQWAPGGAAGLDDVLAHVVRAAHAVAAPALVCEEQGGVLILLSLAVLADADTVVDNLGSRLRKYHDALVAAGRTTLMYDEIDRSLTEANQVADAVPTTGAATDSTVVVHRLSDLHIRGLIGLLAGDTRLDAFVGRELSPLRRHDAQAGARKNGTLMPVVRALLRHPVSKSSAAASLHLSRAAFYDRLARIERLLGVDLDDPEVRTSLHVALLADEMSDSLSD
ncbi:PucR family transcriptional regulator [Rhodococcus sp. IEGM1428]|uniref:PucR family transcriptional regulator n=1 Tax=Rhodococcus sp. IEGM1428 TaxID=3392191 RepID=UPI003D104C24